MEAKEKISVIVPVYNSEKYLNDCIKSIVEQTYPNLEIVLVNDNSKDNSMKIMTEWAKKDSRIVNINNFNGNHGTAAARNIGLNNANGDLIAFCDDDDTIKPNMLYRLYELMNQHGADVSFCSREVVSDWFVDSWEDKGIKVFEGGVSISDLANQFDFNMVWTKLYKKEIFDGLRLPEDIRFGNDLWIMPEVYEKAGKVVYTSERLYNYYLRRNNDSFTMAKDDDTLWGLARTHRKIFEYSIRNNCDMSIPIHRMRHEFVEAMWNGSDELRNKAIMEFRELYRKHKDILRHHKKCVMTYYFPYLPIAFKKLQKSLKNRKG